MSEKDMSLRYRVVSRLEALGMSQVDLADRLNINPQNITHWFNRGNIPTPKLLAVCTALNCRPEWLLSGDPPIEPTGPAHLQLLPSRADDGLEYVEEFQSPDYIHPHALGKCPLISWVQAGDADLAIDLLAPGDAEDWLHCPKPHSRLTYILRVRGDSMTSLHGGKSYPNGCLIFVDPEQRGGVVPGEYVIAKLNGHDAVTFKQLAEDNGRRFLKPINTQYEPIREEFRVLGKVIGKFEE